MWRSRLKPKNPVKLPDMTPKVPEPTIPDPDRKTQTDGEMTVEQFEKLIDMEEI